MASSPQQLHAIVRTLGEVPEILAAWADRAEAAGMAGELGAGHHVAPVRVVEPGTGFVAHVWWCRAIVEDGRSVRVVEPERLGGASRLVLDTEDMPSERVHVDDVAAELEVAVHGRSVRQVNAYAAAPERARELAESKARELLGDR